MIILFYFILFLFTLENLSHKWKGADFDLLRLTAGIEDTHWLQKSSISVLMAILFMRYWRGATNRGFLVERQPATD